MFYLLAFILPVAAIALWRHQSAKQKNHRSVHDASHDCRNSYRCVEVHAGIAVCEAAQRLGNARFLYEEVPELPLPGCTAQTCTCIYIHHDDRRKDGSRNAVGQSECIPYATVGERRSRNAQYPKKSGTKLPHLGFTASLES